MGMIGNQAGFASPTSVSDVPNTSTGAFDVPSGTTAQRPAAPSAGYLRFNTELDCMENYTASGWLKVSIPIPVLASISGNIYSGAASTLTLSGNQFGAGVVRFTSNGTTKDVAVTPSSVTSASVTVPAEIYGLSASSVVSIKFINNDGGQSNAIEKTVFSLPAGGTVTTSGGYRYHTFTTSASLSVPSGLSIACDYLCIAGGGGGGADSYSTRSAGGGGAGGYLSGSATLNASATIVVGAGGTGGVYPAGGADANGSNGGNSTTSGPFSLTAIGGGGGAGHNTTGNNAPYSGGSGGGACNDVTGAAGTAGQGYRGGNSNEFGGGNGVAWVDSVTRAAGGGGAGSATWYPGGGGGASGTYQSSLYAGGTGGGGAGGYSSSTVTGGAGTTNTGSGGGASRTTTGGNGGSGVVIIRYQL